MAARHKGKHKARHHINPNKPSVFAKLPPLPTEPEASSETNAAVQPASVPAASSEEPALATA